MRDLDLARLAGSSLADEYHGLAVVLDSLLVWQVQCVYDRRASDTHLSRQARAETGRVCTRDVEADVERSRRVVPRPHFAAACAGDRLDRRRQAFALHRVNRDFG